MEIYENERESDIVDVVAREKARMRRKTKEERKTEERAEPIWHSTRIEALVNIISTLCNLYRELKFKYRYETYLITVVIK